MLLVIQWLNGKLAWLEVENFRLEPWLAHCVVFLDMIHNSHNATLHTGVLKDGRKLGGWGGLALHAFLFFPLRPSALIQIDIRYAYQKGNFCENTIEQ